MRKDLITLKPLQSSFLSVEQDTETLIRTLFIDTKPYSDILKSLLVVNEPDCLDIKKYKQVLDSYSVKNLIDNNYIRLNPRVEEMAHEDLKTTILISFDEFTPNQTNELFLNNAIYFDIICPYDSWNLDNFKIRPVQICGYIDGIFNLFNQYKRGLSGAGKYMLVACQELILNEYVGGYTLKYMATHFSEDKGNVGE